MQGVFLRKDCVCNDVCRTDFTGLISLTGVRQVFSIKLNPEPFGNSAAHDFAGDFFGNTYSF